MESIESVIHRLRNDRGADMLDVYRLCDSHDALSGALSAICAGHHDPKALAQAALDFVTGRQSGASKAS